MVSAMVCLHRVLAAPPSINPPPPSTFTTIRKTIRRTIRKRYSPNRWSPNSRWPPSVRNIHTSYTMRNNSYNNYSTYLLVSKGVCLLRNSPHFHFVNFFYAISLFVAFIIFLFDICVMTFCYLLVFFFLVFRAFCFSFGLANDLCVYVYYICVKCTFEHCI